MPDALIRYEFTEDGLKSALEALGTTPNAVATNLSAMGFRGSRDECRHCPVANYVTAVVKGAVATDVLLDDDDPAPYVRVYASLTPEVRVEAAGGTTAVAAFIRMFDAALYPHLIDEDED